ncbi:hypothetical protein [Rathayibacter festucae]|uniref:HoxN/HupN/NixA family nickel/cobalt transporter n=1 Tax=Rathayibacter festucae TaxID=110937 RepID=UPI002A6A9438|nr:hypothetical protein [Rathayibacter festucae]MDY0914803.1 hypothetical protein [Rathayibacter festucae]
MFRSGTQTLPPPPRADRVARAAGVSSGGGASGITEGRGRDRLSCGGGSRYAPPGLLGPPHGPQQLEQLLRRRGLLSRLVDRAGERISSPRRMYLVGFLFGLGFDTATEIGLLVLAGTASAYALPQYAILTLPVLFTAGMCALDTAQGIVMRRAYTWAGAIPRRAFAYNVAVTTISLVIAFAIGIVELSSVAAAQLTLDWPVSRLGTIDLGGLGFALTGLVLTAWLCLVLAQRVASRQHGRPAASPSETQ